MVDMKQAISHLEKNIAVLEKELYNFETVAMNRYEGDKKILRKMREDVVKIEIMMQKRAEGVEISADELIAALPAAFR